MVRTVPIFKPDHRGELHPATTVQRIMLAGADALDAVDGVGLTEGVHEEWFAEWLAENPEHDAVRAGRVYVVRVENPEHDAVRPGQVYAMPRQP